MEVSRVLFLAFGLTLLASAFSVSDWEWESFKSSYGKSYLTDEENQERRQIYQANLKKIHEHNAKNLSYRLAMNRYGDWTKEEYMNLLGMRKQMPLHKQVNGSAFLGPSFVSLPDNVDWRKKGYVTGVKNQGACGSCWAFSTTGSLEGQHYRKTGRLVSLSEQNLVDCSTAYGNKGCGGGLMDQAFAYIKANGGVDTEASYPYTAQDGECKFETANVGATVTGHVDISSGDESELKTATATVGPISVAIDASHSSFQLYSSGVYDEEACSPVALDHGVLVVGYGTLNGDDYWLVKNSWGSSWGEDGYIKMSRNKDNQCGIATKASYPLV